MRRRNASTLNFIENYVKDHESGLRPEEIRSKYGVSMQTFYRYMGEISEKSGIPKKVLLKDPAKAPKTLTTEEIEEPKANEEAKATKEPKANEEAKATKEPKANKEAKATKEPKTAEETTKEPKATEPTKITEDETLKFGRQLLAEIQRAQSCISNYIIKQENYLKNF